MSAMWTQFRRLLLGTVVEYLLEEGIAVDFSSITIEFHEESEFRVPRLDNYMRFKGSLRARLTAAPPPGAKERLAEAVRGAWPGLLSVLDLPIGDRLTSDRNRIDLVLDDEQLALDFDLVAD